MGTEEERERRLADLLEQTRLGRRLRRLPKAQTTKQPSRVQRLVAEQRYLTSQLRAQDYLADDEQLPDTALARDELVAAYRRLVAALEVEIRAARDEAADGEG